MSADRAEVLTLGLQAVTGSRQVSVNVQATGGLSQETWLVTVDGRPAVLRLPTPASGARSILTQRAALQLTHSAGLPVPDLLAFDDGGDNAFGVPYLLMERAVGDIPRGWNELPPERRRQLGLDAMRLLGDLQRIDASTAVGLRSPKTDPGVDELAFYRRRFAHLGVGTRGTVEVALRWLEAHRPTATDLVVVHNDFRMGNFVIGGDAITSVLDWELAAIGHPLADLTWCFIAVWEVVDVDVQEMYAAYEQASGRRVDLLAARWYTAMGYLRLLYYGLSGGAAFAAGELHDLRQPALRLQGPIRVDRLLRVIDNDGLSQFDALG